MSKRALLFTAILALATLATLAAAPGFEPVVLQRTATGVAFSAVLPHDGVQLRVSTPDGAVFARDFSGLDTPAFSLTDERGLFRGDGQYTWEVRLTPVLGAAARKEMAEARDRGDEATLRDLQRLYLPAYPMVYSGTFRVERGSVIYDPNSLEPESVPTEGSPRPRATAGEGTRNTGGGIEPNQVITGDLTVRNSLCTGLDCLDAEGYGSDTIRLKENNLRIHFDDTSVSPFPENDWRIVANDSASGGASYLAIEDSTAARTLVRFTAGAPANSLFMDSSGRLGRKTATPVLELHLVDGDTPTVRLDQDGTSGWAPQIWDVAANETNFFIRDSTNGSKLSFRIQPNTPANSLCLRSDGKVGMGTWSPAADLEIQRTGAEASFLLNRTDGTPWRMGTSTNGLVFAPDTTGTSTVFRLGATGDLLLSGVLTQGSSREIKSACAALGPGLLQAVAQLPVQLWSYTADPAQTRHAGPMAEDFYRLFGLGGDDRHVAPSDVAGVTLAAVQELIRSGAEKDAQIESLREENAQLAARLARIEARLLTADPATAH